MNTISTYACSALLAGAAALLPLAARAQTPAASETPPASQAPSALVLHFDSGSATIRADDLALLDQASRLYSDGHPIVMVLTGGSDSVGSPERNLQISQRRTLAVLHGLVARGIPAERFQLLAKGESEPAVPAQRGVAEAQNRRVEIRWR